MKNCILKLHSYYNDFFRSSDLRKGISKVYGGDVLSNVINVGTALLVIRGLPIGDYAAYTAFYSILTLVPWLLGSGINYALIRFSAEQISKSNEKPVELYVISYIFQFVLYLILAITMFLLSDQVCNLLFGQKAFDSSLRYGLIAGAGLLISQAGRGIYNAEEKFGSYIKAIWLRQSLIFLIIALFFLLKQLSFNRAAQVIIFVELTVGGIITFHIFRDVNITGIITGFRKQSSTIKEFISSTKWLIAYFIVIAAFQKLDVFMLSHFSSENEFANYGVAFRYYSIAMLALSSIHAVLLPKFSRVDMQDLDKQRQFSYKWLRTTIWLIVPLAIADIFGKSIFILINGMQYEKAFHIFTIFSIGILLSLMFSPLVQIIMARKAFKFLFLMGTGALILNFAGNYFLIPVWGGLGTALVVVLTNGLINIASWIRIVYSTR